MQTQLTLPKHLAIKAMQNGRKMRHRLFTEAEWVTMKDGMMLFEDGHTCTPAEFWNVRFGQVWFDGWIDVTEVNSD
jgi:hypothetical protein